MQDDNNYKSQPRLFESNQQLIAEGLLTIAGPNYPFREKFEIVEPTKELQLQASSSGTAVTRAINLGLLFWKIARSNPDSLIEFELDGSRYRFTSPDIGFVYLMEHFFENDPNSKLITVLNRGRTLLHEAKHSDCKVLRSCGFSHVKCEQSGPLRGRMACDIGSNGPLGIELDFLAAVNQSLRLQMNEYERQRLILDAIQLQSTIQEAL